MNRLSVLSLFLLSCLGAFCDSLKDLGMWLEVELSEQNVYVHQPVVCSMYLYNPGLQLTGIRSEGNADYGNCDVRMNLGPGQATYTDRVRRDGKVYNVALVSQMVLFPSASGTIEIKCPDLAIGVATESGYRDPFFGFFGPRQSTTVLATPDKLRLKVRKLPSKAPADFTGAVGEFKVTASVPPGRLVKGNECLLVYEVNGTGSLEDIKFPALDSLFPESWKVVAVSPDDNLYIQRGEVVSRAVVEVTFVPTSSGKVTLPPLEFSFFNPATGKYDIARSNEVTLDVKASYSDNSSSKPVDI